MNEIAEIIDLSDIAARHAEQVQELADLRETLAGYIDARKDLQKELDELRQRNAAFAAEVQKLQHERDVAKRESAERATIEQMLRAQMAETAAEAREARDEASILGSDLLDARSALAEMAMALAEARADSRK